MTSPGPEQLIRQVVATYRPPRVIPFRSHARDAAKAESNHDLMVVLDDDALHRRKLNETRRRPLDPTREIRQAFGPIDDLARSLRAAIDAP